MVCIGFPSVLDSKVINSKTESDRALHLGEESHGMGNGYVAVRGQVFYQAFVGNDARLREAIHAFLDFDEDMVLVY